MFVNSKTRLNTRLPWVAGKYCCRRICRLASLLPNVTSCMKQPSTEPPLLKSNGDMFSEYLKRWVDIRSRLQKYLESTAGLCIDVFVNTGTRAAFEVKKMTSRSTMKRSKPKHLPCESSRNRRYGYGRRN